MANAEKPKSQEESAATDEQDQVISESDQVQEETLNVDSAEAELVDAADAGIEGEAEVGEIADFDELLTQLRAAEEEMVRFRDMALRSEAEMQNLRRRAERDVEQAHKFALERFVQNLLPVIDSLEKAVEAGAETEGDPVIEGVRLCLKMFMDVLGKEKVETLDPVGEPFDPQVHEAISMIENPEVESGSVVIVIQKGYRLNERLVRPAMVIVSK